MLAIASSSSSSEKTESTKTRLPHAEWQTPSFGGDCDVYLFRDPFFPRLEDDLLLHSTIADLVKMAIIKVVFTSSSARSNSVNKITSSTYVQKMTQVNTLWFSMRRPMALAPE